jgi:hypothetical protein
MLRRSSQLRTCKILIENCHFKSRTPFLYLHVCLRGNSLVPLAMPCTSETLDVKCALIRWLEGLRRFAPELDDFCKEQLPEPVIVACDTLCTEYCTRLLCTVIHIRVICASLSGLA